MNNYPKLVPIFSTNNLTFVFISILLSVSVIVISGWNLYAVIIILLLLLGAILGERFILAIIIISLFTLIRDVSGPLRTVIHLVDFSLLGYLFLKRFGLNFNSYPRVLKPVKYFLILYCSAMIIAAAMSSYPLAGINLIAQQLAFFVIVYFFYSLIKDEREVKNYFYAIIVVSSVIATSSIVPFISEDQILFSLDSKYRSRVAGMMGNTEAATTFFVISIPILIIQLLRVKKKITKYLILLVLTYLAFGLFLMMSRSALIGILISTLIILYTLKRKIFNKFIAALFILIALFLIYEPITNFFSLIFRIEEGLSARQQTWTMALNIIGDHPVFGIGPGAYKYEMFNYFPYMLSDWWGKLFIYYHEITEGANFSHNFFLVFFTDMGILGLITALSLPVIYFSISIKTIKRYKDKVSENYYLIIAMFAAGISMIIRNFFNSIGILFYGGITTDLPFWLIISSLVYFYYSSSSNSSLIDNQR